MSLYDEYRVEQHGLKNCFYQESVLCDRSTRILDFFVKDYYFLKLSSRPDVS